MSRKATLSAHLEQLAEHGGGAGIRDEGLIDSALARPQYLAVYGEPDAAALAAAYAFGLARNQPFIDGNKRTALVVSELFLAKNGYAVDASNAEMVVVFLSLAAGETKEAELADWFRERIVPA